MNVTGIEGVSRVSNSAVSNSAKPSVNIGAIIGLPSRNLVGFLSLLNGILGPTETSKAPVDAVPPVVFAPLATLQTAKPGSIDVLLHPSSESEKQGRNLPRSRKVPAEKSQATLNQPDPERATTYAPAAAQAGPGISSIPQLAGEVSVSSGRSGEPRSAAPPQPNSPANESAVAVAFALRLTPQDTESNRSPVAAPQNLRSAHATALKATQSTVQDGVRPGSTGLRGALREFAQPDFGELAITQESGSLPRNLGPTTGLTPTRESSHIVYESETGPKAEGVPPPVRTGESVGPGEPTSARPDGALAAGRTGSGPRLESGMAQMALRGQTPNAGSPEERGNRQGEEGDDPELEVKAPKLYPAAKSDIRAQGAPELCGILPEPSNGVGRTSSRTEPAPLDPPSSARVSLDLESGQSIRPQPLREISLKLADGASNQVDIQVMARAGKVEVAVRTADQELTKSLQTNLGELVGRMEAKGYRTETWIPTALLRASATLPEPATSYLGHSQDGHRQDQTEHSGSSGGQKQQEHQQQEAGRRPQPRWVAQFQETLDGEETSTESIRMEDR